MDRYVSSRFWEILSQDDKLIKNSYFQYREVFNLTIEAWNHFITPHYFHDFKQDATPLLAYKVQADIALKQAISSVLRHEYSQAVYNLRLAKESIVIALFCYANANLVIEEFKNPGSVDKRLKIKAHKFLREELPTRSEKFKGLQNMCNDFGSHLNIGYVSNHFKPNEATNSFDILLVADDRPELTVGLTGIIIGMILEFDFSIQDLSEVDEVKINQVVQIETDDILNKFEAMKSRYRFLYTRLT